ncbi:MAG: PHP domain-containing protein [Actinobacteria bacterium]|nr:PHP domain-containing protein [Actinomycetota bacterium]
MNADLHTHTIHSDGTTRPEENAALAAAAGLGALAVTDHDTTAGLPEAAAACARHGVGFVPGIELSTEHAGRSVHLLGYYIDALDARLVAECDRLRSARSLRARRILAELDTLGVALPLAAVTAHAGSAPIARPHIAAAMVEGGFVPDIAAAFDGFLAEDAPAYVVKHALSPAEGVRLLRAAGGVAVLAHPELSSRHGAVTEELVAELARTGLAGLEADHAGHDGDAVRRWRGCADRLGLLVTGSSDFHGAGREVRIGAGTTPLARLDRLRERAAADRSRDTVTH